jgi:predicted phage terminase large subunit-like protein
VELSPKPSKKKPEPKTYLDFLRRTLPSGWTAEADHIRLIAEHLDKVRRGEIDRLAIHMPPRHGKSETVTYRFPVCWLEEHPSDNVLITGYNQRFANKFGRRTRNLAADLGMVSGDKAAMDEWETSAGGLLMARGVGSPPTGTGFNGILIDDPVRRRQDAESETVRESTEDWYSSDLYQRLEPGGWIVLIMTLWHPEDLGHYAVASEPDRWTVLKLPAFALEDDPLGREPGAALWPERFDVAALERKRRVEGEYSFEATHQQNPTPREGSIFKVGQLDFVDTVPAGLKTVRKWDVAATQDDGDWSAGAKLSGPDADGLFYVEHVQRGQWESATRNRQMRLTAETDTRRVKIIVPEDPGSAGKDSARAFVTLLAGFSVSAVRETGDKATRADPFAAQVNAGNVRLVRGDWNRAFVEELRQFTGREGGTDDQVDAASGAFNELSKVVRYGAV